MHNRLDWQKQLVRAAMCAITVLALAQEALPAEEGPVLSGTALWALAAGAAWAQYGALLRLRRPFAPGKAGRAGRFAGRSGGAGAELCRRGHGGDGDQPGCRGRRWSLWDMHC